MKKILSLVLSIAFTIALTSCTGSTQNKTSETSSQISQTETQTPKTKTIIDHEGVQMEIPLEVNRVVVGNTLPLASALSVYLGGSDKIVGLHPSSLTAAKTGLLGEIYPEILTAKTDFINGSEVNIEELLKLNPDIVIGVSKDQAEAIRKAGIPAATISVSKWDYDVVKTYDEWNSLFDQIFGKSEITEKISEYSKSSYNSIQEKVSNLKEEDKKRVLVLYKYDDEAIQTSGPKFFGQYWTDAVGAINVAKDSPKTGGVTINMEQVYEWNPDVIIITNFTPTQPEDLYNNAVGGDDWSTVNAIKNKQVYKMPLGLYRTFTPGADTPVTLQWFAKTVYPELFEDLNIEEITKSYYKDFHNIEMTNEQIKNMYNPPRETGEGF